MGLLRAYKISFYDMFWQVQGLKEYENDLRSVPFNTATLVGIFRRALKEYDRVHGRATKRNVVPYIKVTEYL